MDVTEAMNHYDQLERKEEDQGNSLIYHQRRLSNWVKVRDTQCVACVACVACGVCVLCVVCITCNVVLRVACCVLCVACYEVCERVMRVW